MLLRLWMVRFSMPIQYVFLSVSLIRSGHEQYIVLSSSVGLRSGSNLGRYQEEKKSNGTSKVFRRHRT